MARYSLTPRFYAQMRRRRAETEARAEALRKSKETKTMTNKLATLSLNCNEARLLADVLTQHCEAVLGAAEQRKAEGRSPVDLVIHGVHVLALKQKLTAAVKKVVEEIEAEFGREAA